MLAQRATMPTMPTMSETIPEELQLRHLTLQVLLAISKADGDSLAHMLSKCDDEVLRLSAESILFELHHRDDHPQVNVIE